MDVRNFVGINTNIQNKNFAGEKVLRVIKARKQMDFDENTYAKLRESYFESGIIEVKMFSRLLPDAPDFARGFIGLAFHINNDDSQFEAFYIRPTHAVSVTSDPVRQSHGCQYFSYPGYTFQYFRDHGIADYEGKMNCRLNEWVTLKVIVEDRKAEFYLNGETTPTLKVDKLLCPNEAGSIGFFVDIGTEAYFKDLQIETWK